MRTHLQAALIAAAAGIIGVTAPAAAQDYYAGKTIDLVVGNYPGGGFDIYARAVARHLGRNIPGNPTIVVKNMPGAGSAKAGVHISQIAPKDGLSIGAVTPGRDRRPAARRQAAIDVRPDQGRLSRHRQQRHAHLRHLREVEGALVQAGDVGESRNGRRGARRCGP